MKNLVVTVIIAIVVVASFSQVNAQSIYPAGTRISTIGVGDIIDIGVIGNDINEERKIYVRVEDNNNTDGKGKIHFKLRTEDGKNVRSYNVKSGKDLYIALSGDDEIYYIDIIKVEGDISFGTEAF